MFILYSRRTYYSTLRENRASQRILERLDFRVTEAGVPEVCPEPRRRGGDALQAAAAVRAVFDVEDRLSSLAQLRRAGAPCA